MSRILVITKPDSIVLYNDFTMTRVTVKISQYRSVIGNPPKTNREYVPMSKDEFSILSRVGKVER